MNLSNRNPNGNNSLSEKSEQLLFIFKEYLRVKKNSSPLTIKNYASDVAQFLRWIESKTNIEFNPATVTTATFDEYQTDKGVSARSFDRHLSSLRKFFTFMAEQKIISFNPFEQAAKELIAEREKQDPWYMKEFKDYLYVFGAADLTIKNYIIDIQGFTKWCEETLQSKEDFIISDEGLLTTITPEIIHEYKDRLLNVLQLSPNSINRKLSSIRKYFEFLEKTDLLGSNITDQGNVQTHISNISSSQSFIEAPKPEEFEATLSLSDITHLDQKAKRKYSKIPPVRLLQKVLFVPYVFLEGAIAAKIAALLPEKVAAQTAVNAAATTIPQAIKSIPKEFYAPHLLSTKNLPFMKKLMFHIKYTRPNWYKTYHSYTFTHYFHIAVLVIFASAIGFAAYNTLVLTPGRKNPTLAAGPIAPPRILSFQGRLTDSSDTPITSTTNIRFAIYDTLAATGSSLLWQEVQYAVAPDQDGVFSINLGTNTTIPQSVFAQNDTLYLGVTIENTSELTPRQRLAAVAFATNAEVLQGMPPITQVAAGTSNVILALDSSGNLTIGGSANPIFQASGGQFKLSGQPLYLTTNTGTSGNVVVHPDGLGMLDVERPIVNVTSNGNLSPGAVEIQDKFAINATESAVAAFLVNNNTSGGDIIAASSSGATKLVLSNAGNLSLVAGSTIDTLSSGTLGIGTTNATTITIGRTGQGITLPAFTGTNGVLYGTNGTGAIAQATTSTSNLCLVSGATAPSWSSCSAAAGSNVWVQNNALGTLYPGNSTVDMIVGGTATNSAKFAVLNVAGGITTATVAGNIVAYPQNGAGGSVAIGTLAPRQALDVVGNGIFSGNVGIGTTVTTNASLDVVGPGPAGGLNFRTAGDIMVGTGSTPSIFFGGTYAYTSGNYIRNTSSGTLEIFGGGTDKGSTQLAVVNGFVGIGNNAPSSVFYVSGLNNKGNALAIFDQIGASTADILTASASGQTRLTLRNNGNLGIGTSLPGFKLDVIGDARVSGNNLYVGGVASTGLFFTDGTTSNYGVYRNASNNLAFRINSTSDQVVLDSNGNIGVGTTSPVARLDVRGLNATTPTASISANSNYAALVIDNLGTGDLIAASGSGVKNFRVKNNGDVVVGLNGTGKLTAGVIDPYLIQNQYTTGTTSLTFQTMGASGGDFIFQNQASTLMTLLMNGNLGIGSAAPTQKLDVVGNMQIAGDIVPNNATRNLGSLSNPWNFIYANNIVSGSTGTSGFWSQNNGLLYPANSTVDFALGGTATNSAKFAVLNVNNGTPIASVSSGTNGTASYHTADGTFATTNRQTLTIGNSSAYNTTGNVLINPNGTGNVGIATTNPSAKLQVNGSILATGANVNPNANGVQIGDDGTAGFINALASGGSARDLGIQAQNLIFYSGASSYTEKIRFTSAGYIGIGTSSPASVLEVKGTNGSGNALAILNQTQTGTGADIFTASQSGTTRFVITGAGNVGIGSSIPSNRIDVVHAGTAVARFASSGSNNAFATIDNIAGSQQSALQLSDAGTVKFQIGKQTDNSFFMYDAANTKDFLRQTTAGNTLIAPSSGNVSIGTTNVTKRLTVSTTSNADGILVDGTTSPGYALANSGTIKSYLGLATASDAWVTGSVANDTVLRSEGSNILFSTDTGSNSLLTLKSGNGNVGIGSLSPQAKLDLVGTLKTSAGVTFSTFTSNGGVLYTNGSGVLSQVTAGTNTQCLLGGTTPAFGSCGTGTGANLWVQNNAQGTLYPGNSTVDFLIGGTATNSANFAVLNNAGGTPTATVAGNFIVMPKTVAGLPVGGNVGIGTITPTKSLVLSQKSTSDGFQFTGTSIDNTNSGTGFLFALGHNASGNKQMWFGDPDGAGNASYNFMRFVSNGSGSIPTLDGVTGDGVSRAKIMLGVAGDSNSGVYVGQVLGVNGYAAIGSSYYNGSGPTNGLIVQGNVGLGTTTPASVFDVQGTFGKGNALAIFNQTQVAATADVLTASVSGSTKFVIDHSGNVGIGTSLPLSQLANTNTNIVDAAGTGVNTGSMTWAFNNSGYGSAVYNASTASNANGFLVKGAGTATSNKLFEVDSGASQASAGTGLFVVQGNGNVGVASVTPGATFDVVGTGRFSSTLTASSGFTVSAGSITFTPFNSNGGVLFTNGSGVLSQVTAGTATQCLLGGTTPTFGSCAAGTGANLWSQNNAQGTLYPGNSTVDLLVGGTATNSAKFAVLNVAGGITTATVAGNIIAYPQNGAGGAVGIGTLSPRYALDVVGNGIFSGNLGVGTTNPGAQFVARYAAANSSTSTPVAILDNPSGGSNTVLSMRINNAAVANIRADNANNLLISPGSAGGLYLGWTDLATPGPVYFRTSNNYFDTSNNLIVNGGNLGLGTTTPTTALLEVGSTSQFKVTSAGNLSTSGSVTFSTFTSNGGVLYTNGSGLLSQVTAGTNTQCLLGGTTPAFGSCATGINNLWSQNNATGTLYPGNSTVDLLVGGTATNSAKFAVLNVAGGITTATVAGNIIAYPQNGAGGAIGIGTLSPRYALDVIGNGIFSGNVGIGSAVPTQKLDIGGNAVVAYQSGFLGKNSVGNTEILAKVDTGTIGATNGTTNISIHADPTNVNGWQIGSTNAGVSGDMATTKSLSFVTNGAERMRFDSGGNLGIGTTVPASVLEVKGTAGANAAMRVIQNSSDTAADLFTASAGATTRFTIRQNGNVGIGSAIPGAALDVVGTGRFSSTLTASNAFTVSAGSITFTPFTSNGGLLYTNGSGVLSQVTAGTNTQCLLGGTTPAFGSCTTGQLDQFWSQRNGTLFANNSTVDFLIGGQATNSAKFAVLNVNSGITTATVAGNIIAYPQNGAGGAIGIGTLSPRYALDVIGNGIFSGNVGVGSAVPGVALDVVGSGRFSSTLTASNAFTVSAGSITFTPFTSNGGLLFTNGTGVVSQVTAGTNTQCLLGGTTPAFGSCSTGQLDQFWSQRNGTLFANNSTVDFLIGGQATNSAKFAILNVASGVTTATVAGNMIIAQQNGAGGLLGIGTLSPRQRLDVVGNGIFSGNVGIGSANPGYPLELVATGSTDQYSGSRFAVTHTTATAGSVYNALFSTNDTHTSGTMNGVYTFFGQSFYGGTSAASPAVTSLNTGYFRNGINGTSPTGTITTANVLFADGLTGQAGGSPNVTITNNNGLNIGNQGPITGVAVTNATGISVSGQTGGGTNNIGIQVLGSNGGSGSNFNIYNVQQGTGLTNPGYNEWSYNLQTIDTTATARNNYAHYIYNNGTRSTGGNNLTNIGLYVTAFGAQLNYAAIFDQGNVGIGSTTPGTTLDVTGTGRFSSTLTASNNLTVSAGSITFSPFTSNGGVLYTNGSGQLAQATAGSSSQCLLGGTTPTFGSCGGSIDVFWNQTSGALYPNNSTVDFLVGAQATTSAKFAVLNVANGTPTASVSSGLNGTALSFDAAGNIQTAANGTLTIGGTTTGNIALAEKNITLNSTKDGENGNFITPASPDTLPAPKEQGGAAFANGYLYYVGGGTSAGGGATATVWYNRANANGTLNGWRATTSLPDNRSGHTTIAANGYLYAIGGYNAAGTAQSTVFYARINPDGTVGAWNTLPNLPNVLYGHATVVAGGYVYTIGGFAAGGAATTAVNYAKLNPDGTIGTWTATTVLPNVRTDPAAVVANGYMYVLGGSQSGTDQNTVYYAAIFPNGTVGNWATTTVLPGTLSQSTALTANGYIYSIGGFLAGSATTANVYYAALNSDGTIGSWTTSINSLPAALRKHESLMVNGYIYNLAGMNNSSVIVNSVYYSSVARVSIAANLDLLGLTSLNMSSASGDLSQGSSGGSIFAGNIFSMGQLSVNGASQFWSPVGINGSLSLVGTGRESAPLLFAEGNTGNKALAIFNQLSNTADILTASSSGTTQLYLTNGGTLNTRAFSDLDDSTYFLDPAATGNSMIVAGNVGIGVKYAGNPLASTSPLAKLHVYSNLGTAPAASISARTSFAALIVTNDGAGPVITASSSGKTVFEVRPNGDTLLANGVGKIYAAGLDPRYTIDGKRYSTFAPSMSGMKEEITGAVNTSYDAGLQAYAYTMDFNSFKRDSDMWVFSRVIDPNISMVTALLSSSSNARTWYTKDPVSRKITFYSDVPTQISYRLTAPRFDYKKWPTIATDDDTVEGLIAPPPPSPVGTVSSDPNSVNSAFNSQMQIQKRYNSAGQPFYALVDGFGNIIKRADSFSSLIAANIKAGFVTAQEGAFDNLSVGGKSIRDFIVDVIHDTNRGNTVASPLTSADKISTDIVSPLDNSGVSLKLKDGKLEVNNKADASGAAVLTIDNKGNLNTAGDLSAVNATLSGSLTTAQASVAGTLTTTNLNATDATISGTLHAGNIDATSINGLDEKIKAQLNSVNTATTSGGLTMLPSGNVDITNLSANFALIHEDLISLGTASFNEASVMDQLSIGTTLTLSNNTINTLGSDLEINPLRQGNVSFLGGLIKMDTEGNLEVQGNASFAKDVRVNGSLTAGLISPLADGNLIISLNSVNNPSQQFEIHNASDSAVFAVNQKGDVRSAGDLIASGAATFAKLNLRIADQAYATSETTAVATGSAGMATLKANKTELTIVNKNVTEKSLIYITPVGATSKVISLLRQVGENASQGQVGSFTVGVSSATTTDIKFNWIIVN